MQSSKLVKNKSFKAMGIDLSLSENTVRAWFSETDDRTSPDARALIALGRVYEANLTWLLLGEGGMRRRPRQAKPKQ